MADLSKIISLLNHLQGTKQCSAQVYPSGSYIGNGDTVYDLKLNTYISNENNYITKIT